MALGEFSPSSVSFPGGKLLRSFRCLGPNTSLQSEAQVLMLTAEAWPAVVARRGHSSLYRLLNSLPGCGRFQCLSPNPWLAGLFQDLERGREAGGQVHFESLGTYFCFFQPFSGSPAGLPTEVAPGRGNESGKLHVDGQLRTCSGWGTHVTFSNPHRKPASLGLSPSTLRIKKGGADGSGDLYKVTQALNGQPRILAHAPPYSKPGCFQKTKMVY